MSETIGYIPPENDNTESHIYLSDNPEIKALADENKEFELTPEIKAKVMEMVQDIHEPGIGYTGASLHKFEDFEAILHSGILTPPTFEKRMEHERGRGGHFGTIEEQRESYVESVRSRDPNLAVWFNVTGRCMDLPKGKEFSDAFWHKQDWKNIVVLFNMSSYKELNYDIRPGRDEYEDDNSDEIPIKLEKELAENTFSYASEQALRGMAKPGKGLPEKVYSEYGFRMRGRINPKSFEGIIVSYPSFGLIEDLSDQVMALISKTPKSAEEGQKKKDSMKYLMDEIAEQYNRISIWTKSMFSTQKYLPIYSNNGGLFWPEYMSYEKVKQFVTERNEKQGQEIEQ